jgi:hypothetical protein
VRKLIIAAAALSLIGICGNACFGETQLPPPPAKADIWGFYPGMKQAELFARLRANNLSCEGKWDITKSVEYNFISCYLKNEPAEQRYGRFANIKKSKIFHFYQTQFLSPGVIWNVTYDFFSGKSRQELMSEISSIYNVQSEFLSPENRSNVCGRGFTGPIAKWELGTKTLVLEDAQTYIIREGIHIAGWGLVLCDEQFLAKDAEAFEQKKRSVGPATKF